MRGGAAPRSAASTSAPPRRHLSEVSPGPRGRLLHHEQKRVKKKCQGTATLQVPSSSPLRANALARGDYGSLMVVGCGWEGRRASEDEAAAAGAILHRLGERESSSTEGLGASLRRTGGVLGAPAGQQGGQGGSSASGTNVTWTSVWRRTRCPSCRGSWRGSL